MNEVEKMYENAGIKSEWRYIVHQFCHFYEADKEDILRNKYLFKERKTARIKKAEKKYPPFTAEKQLELIKFLLDKYCDIRIRKNLEGEYYIKSFNDISCFSEDFEETLASFMNTHLQDLTEEERKQIKEILE